MLDQLDEAFREGATGLLLRENAREKVESMLARFKIIAAGIKDLQGPMHQFADRVATDDDLHKAVAKMLKTRFTLFHFANDIEYGGADIEAVTKKFLSQILVEQDGQIKVMPTEVSEEEIIEQLSRVFRRYRSTKRRIRELNETFDRISDKELHSVLQTLGGKLAFVEHVQRHAAEAIPNGLEEWIADHFERNGDGYQIKNEEVREKLSEVVKQIDEVTQELKDADF